MEELMSVGIIFGILVILAFVFYYIEKIVSITMMVKQTRAYDLICKEEELTIKHLEDKKRFMQLEEKREENMCRKQSMLYDEIAMNEKRRTEYMNVIAKNTYRNNGSFIDKPVKPLSSISSNLKK